MKQQNGINNHQANEHVGKAPEGFTLFAHGGPFPYPAGALAKNGTILAAIEAVRGKQYASLCVHFAEVGE